VGVVYAAADERLRRHVAIETIRAASVSEESRQRLWREARALARLHHPRVCRIFEADEDAGRRRRATLLHAAPLHLTCRAAFITPCP
jgi:eukaryotic-like serine/threonine-protein kinase